MLKLKPLALLLAAAFAVPAVLASTQGVVISQVYGGGGNTGATIKNDFIELFNASATAVNIGGWSVQYASSTGTSWSTTAIPAGTTLQPGRYLLIAESAGAGGTALTGDVTGSLALSATTGKVALVSSTTALTGAPPSSSQIVDVLGFGAANYYEGAPIAALTNTTAALRKGSGCTDSDNNANDFDIGTPAPRNSATAAFSCSGGGTPVNQPIVPNCPDSAAVAGTASSFNVTATDADSIVNGAAVTGTAWPNGFTLGSFSSAGSSGGTASQQINVAASVAAGSYTLNLQWANNDAQTASCAIKVAVSGLVTVPQIQGSGARSPFEGQVVTTTGIVTLLTNNGFYLQDRYGDNDPSTSDGVFVYTSTAPTVSVGDELRLGATVSEYSVSTSAASQAAPLTELTAITALTVLSRGNQTPAPVEIDLEQEQGNLERFEGMLVTVKGPLTVTQSNFVGQYGQLTLAAGGRTLNPTNVMRPGTAANALAAANLARSIILDDDSSLTNPNPTPYLAADKTVRAGDTLDSVTGVVDFGPSGASASGELSYKINPSVAPVITRANARTTQPDPVGGNLRIASANIENFFTTFTDGTTADGQVGQGCALGGPTGTVSASNCRGADNLNEFTRQRTKVLASLGAINADVVGLMEAQNNGDVAVQSIVSGLNALMGAGTYAIVPQPAQGTGTDAIRVAMIYKPASVSLQGASLSDPDPINNRAPFAQGFVAPNGQSFAVVVNHLKAKSSCPSSGPDADNGDRQSCWNATRVAQTSRLRAWLPQVEAAAGTTDVIMVGDFNSYAQEDPIYTLTADGSIVDLVSLYDPTDYSYVYDGFSGRLDQALGTASIASKITGAHSWHINADEPPLIDYNTDGKSVDYYTPTPYRSSDHDPLVLGLNLQASLVGTSGRDTIVGTAGDDVIEGGAGADTLTGGGGHNQFVYRNILDAGDTITDFKPGQDTLVFTQLLQSLGVSSSDPLGGGYVTCTMSGTSAVIGVDTDGSAGPLKSRAIVQLKNVNCSAINAASFKF